MIKKGIILADIHLRKKGPTKNLRAVLGFLPYWKPDIFILLGDYMDFESLNPWAENNRRSILDATLAEEYEVGNDLLREIADNLPRDSEKYFHVGNHERRVDLYLYQNRHYSLFSYIRRNISPLTEVFLKFLMFSLFLALIYPQFQRVRSL